jgi:hypothetical protein
MRPPAGRSGTRVARPLRLAVVVALLVGAYYLVPVAGPATAGTAVRSAVTVVVLGVAAWFVGREVLRSARSASPADRLGRLLLALVVGVLVFALADYVVARTGEGQFVGLETRTDALYFSLTTLGTVGFGDVHAAGQLARVIVSLQMIFDFAVLATAAQILWRGFTEHAGTGARGRT